MTAVICAHVIQRFHFLQLYPVPTEIQSIKIQNKSKSGNRKYFIHVSARYRFEQ